MLTLFTIIIVLLIAGLGAGMAWGGRLPELDEQERRRDEPRDPEGSAGAPAAGS